MSTENKIAIERQYWMAQECERLDDFLDRCESPIEKLFLMAALNHGGWELGSAGPWEEWKNGPHAHPSVVAARPKPKPFYSISRVWGPSDCDKGFAQLPIKIGEQIFRLDFALWLGKVRFAIELDGHDFHEKTKEQARKEKSRQRILTADGWQVLRFTGSEVYADASKCWDEIDAVASALRNAEIRSRRP